MMIMFLPQYQTTRRQISFMSSVTNGIMTGCYLVIYFCKHMNAYIVLNCLNAWKVILNTIVMCHNQNSLCLRYYFSVAFNRIQTTYCLSAQNRQIIPSETDVYSTGQEIPCFYGAHVCERTPLNPILSQFNSVHTTYLSNNVFLPSTR